MEPNAGAYIREEHEMKKKRLKIEYSEPILSDHSPSRQLELHDSVLSILAGMLMEIEVKEESGNQNGKTTKAKAS